MEHTSFGEVPRTMELETNKIMIFFFKYLARDTQHV